MKKLILFLLLPLWAMAQTSTGQEQEFDYGIKNNSTQTITTPPYLTTTGMDGTQGKIPSALIEKTDNKQNSLTVDGTGTKYPTVDAVNVLKWIKSNESLSLAQRKGDVLYGILDQYTGEEMTLSKVTGTPTVDGVIYFQLGAEYFKRNNSEVIDLRWFRADNVLVQSMLGYSNVKYLVSRDFDLNGAAITIPTGCSLIFKNGVFTNFASITGDFTKIEAGVTKIFDLSGTVSGFTVAEAYPEWFGAFGNNYNNDYAPFQKCLTSFKKLYLSAKNYYVSGNLTATQDVIIIGKGAETVITAGTTGEFLTLGDDTYLTDFGIGYYKNVISNFEINAESTVTTVIKSKGIRWVNYDLLTVRGGAVGIHIIGAFKMSSLRKVDLPHQTTTNCVIEYTNNFVLDQVGFFGNIGGTTGLKITSSVGQQCKNITLQACDFEGLSEAVNVKGYDVSNINILNSWFEVNTTDVTFDNSLETLTSLNINGGFFQGNIYLGTVDQAAGTKLINGVTIDNIQIENGDIYVRGAATVQDCSFGSANSFRGSGSIIYADAPHLINPGRGAELPAHELMPRYVVSPEVAVSTSEVRSSQGEIRYNNNEASIKTSKGWAFLPLLYKEEFSFEALPDTSTIDLTGVNVGSFVGTEDLYNFIGEVQGHTYTLVGGVGCNKLIVHSDSSIKLVDGQNVRMLEGDIITFQCIGASLVKEVYRNIAAYNYAPRISPVFTGTPTAPTAVVGTNTTQIATMEALQTAKQDLQSVLEKGSDATIWSQNGFNKNEIYLDVNDTNQSLVIAGAMYNIPGAINARQGGFSITDGNPEWYRDINNNKTSVRYTDPIANSILLFPAKSEGTYTLATLDVFSKKYTVSSLPTPTDSEPVFAIVTDALAPTYMATVVGGGTVVCPVFYNGTAWVAH